MSSPVLGAASVEVGADLGKFEPQVKKGTKSAWGSIVSGAGNAGKRAGTILIKTVGKVVKAGAVVAGAGLSAILGVSIAKGLKRLTAIDDAKAKLTGLGHSAKSVQKIMSNALASVEGTAFGLGEAATVAATVVAAGIKPGKQLTSVLKTVADTATIAGTSMGEMGNIFSSVAARGKLQGDDLMQLQSRGVPVLQFLAKEYHVTAKAAADMVSKGQVDFAHFAKAMKDNLGGAALDAGKTVTGSWANVGAALSRLGATILGGVFPHLPKIFANIITAVDNLTAAIKPFVTAWGDDLGTALEKVSARLAAVDFKGLVGWLSRAGTAVKSFLSGLDFSSWSAFVASLKAGIGAGSGSGVGKVLSSIGDSISALMPALHEFVAELPSIGPALAKVAGAGLHVLSVALGFLADHVDTLIKYMPAIVAGFIAWRVASRATANASIALQGVQAALAPVYLANNILRLTAIRLERRNAIATSENMIVQKAMRATTLRGAAALAARNTALAAGGVAAKAAAGRTLAFVAAQKIAAVATKAWAVATRVLGVAMKLALGPVGLVIAGITLLVAGLIYAYKHSEKFRAVVDATWKAIKVAVSAVVDWFTGSVVPFFTTTLPAAFTAAKAGIIGAWDAVTSFISTAYHTVVDPVVTALTTAWGAVVVAFQAVGKAFMAVWNGWISPVLDLFTAIVKWAIGVVVKPYILAAQLAWKALGVAFQWTMSHVISPTIDMFVSGWRLAKKAFVVVVGAVQTAWKKTASFLTAVWNKSVAVVAGWLGSVFRANQVVFGKAMSAVRSAWDTMSRALRKVWDATLGPVAAWLGSKFTAAGRVFSTAMSRVRSHWQSAASYLKSVWNKTISVVLSALSKAVGKVKDAFATAASGIRSAWNKIKGYAKAPVRFVIETVLNNGLIAGFNKLADLFGTKHMSRIPLPRGFATGTPAAPPGLAWTGERGPELVQFKGGERVFTAQQSARMAAAYRNSAVPGYAGGGIVSAIASKAKSFFGGITHPVNWVKDKLGSIIGGIAARFGSNPFVQAIAAIPRKVLDLIIAKVKSGIQSLTANPPGTGVQRWAPTVMRALGIAGLPQTLAYQSAWLKQIATESGGNPHAVQGNIGDINNITGDLAKGLVQVIGATFAAYRDPRLPNDRFNALSNLVAGMRYAAARYGVSGMLGVIGHGHGYDDGGMLPPGITAAINKTGRPERVLTDAQWRALTQRGGDTYHISLRVDAHDLSDLDDVRDLIDMLKRAPAVSRQTRRSGTVTVG